MADLPEALGRHRHDPASRLEVVRRIRSARQRKRPERSAIHDAFRRFAHATSRAVGSPFAFVAATIAILAWAATGPVFGFSDTWQLVINTSTTIVTFLVVFAIQNTQNRDSQAIHLKLDELIRAIDAARNGMLGVENLPDDELTRLEAEMQALCNEGGGTSS